MNQLLIHNYQPADISWSEEELSKFVDNITKGDPIAQCSLCPETNQLQPKFETGTKKVKFFKKGSVAELGLL